MKTLIIGDLEGRSIWKEIINKENPDLTIFLGDYVASRCVSPEQEVETLEELMKYKESNSDKVILLRGNHDLEALGYSWATCYPKAPELSKKWMKENKERFLKNTQWIYIDWNLKTIFSHSGISQVWINETIEPYLQEYIYKFISSEKLKNPLLCMNQIQPCEIFGFIPNNPFDIYGDSKTQSCVWIRPETLAECMIDGYTQVIGHTRIQQCTETFLNLWQCDALNQRNYLVIENGKFKSKGLL